MMGKSNHTGLDLVLLSHIIQWKTILPWYSLSH